MLNFLGRASARIPFLNQADDVHVFFVVVDTTEVSSLADEFQ